MRPSGASCCMLCSAIVTLASLLGQGLGSGVVYSNERDDGGVGSQIVPGENTNVSELVAGMSSLILTPPAEDMTTLIEMGRTLSYESPDKPPSDPLKFLKSLDTLLQKRRKAVENDSSLISKHYYDAGLILTECPVVPGVNRLAQKVFSETEQAIQKKFSDAEKLVKSALDTRCYEFLKILRHHPIWDDRAQEHWFWAMIYGTPACDEDTWNAQGFEWETFWVMIIKAENAALFKRMSNEVFFRTLPKQEIIQTIIKLDASNMLNDLYPDTIKEIAEITGSIFEHKPTHSLNLIFSPPTVKSFAMLRYLFRIGYSRIPKYFMRSKNNVGKIGHCGLKWLVEYGCLPLLQEMALHPNFDSKHYLSIHNYAIESGRVEILQWIVATKKADYLKNIPSGESVTRAIYHSQLEVIKWMIAEFGEKNTGEWTFKLSSPSGCSTQAMKHIYHNTQIHTSRKFKLIVLAMDGKIDELKAELERLAVNFPWRDVANHAACFGWFSILEWVYEMSSEKILPSSPFVVRACQNGHNVLAWIHKIEPIVDSKIFTVEECGIFAATGRRLEIMDWIYDTLPNKIIPDIYSLDNTQLKMTDDTHLLVLKWIKSKDASKITSEMLSKAIEWGHAKALKWLLESMQPLKRNAERAAREGQLECLQILFERKSGLVCTVDVANEAALNGANVHTFEIIDWMSEVCGVLPNAVNPDNEYLKEWLADKGELVK